MQNGGVFFYKRWKIHNSIATICKRGFLDFVHRLYFNKITTFRKLDLLPSSCKKGSTKTLAVYLGSGLRLAQPGGTTARGSVLPFLPEDRRRSSFRSVVILLKYRWWTKSKKQLLQITTHHRQNPLDLIQYSNCFLLHRKFFNTLQITTFRELDLLQSSGEMGPLDRANPNHWTPKFK
jgi:hypothetical protein